MELLFGIDVQGKFSLSYIWNREENCYKQKKGTFLAYTRNCEQKANVAVVKSALKIPPRHNGIIPIKIKGHAIKGNMVYFFSHQDSKKGKISTYPSLMELITPKVMFSSQTTPTNTPLSTKGNM